MEVGVLDSSDDEDGEIGKTLNVNQKKGEEPNSRKYVDKWYVKQLKSIDRLQKMPVRPMRC